ncbi:hypothetical protein DUNSADRAFT_939 [Dunaliella salina]|uniref:Encoded protein n=1 Tax=Dunaliella salina TaxID=3046 RepID=A0ABQ7GXM3_DUNSA|nr:hypothetical protein DUNSADRAFT_939 [Dunaliella salina]|eukprot:KAF5839368.1 hypothetical protein DUNSADRAFT_939 [Dunaliella salina]
MCMRAGIISTKLHGHTYIHPIDIKVGVVLAVFSHCPVYRSLSPLLNFQTIQLLEQLCLCLAAVTAACRMLLLAAFLIVAGAVMRLRLTSLPFLLLLSLFGRGDGS